MLHTLRLRLKPHTHTHTRTEQLCVLRQPYYSLFPSLPSPTSLKTHSAQSSNHLLLFPSLSLSLFADALPQSQSQSPSQQPPLPSPSLSPQPSQQQAPRFITHPSSSGSIVSEGRTKILQCLALGKSKPTISYSSSGRGEEGGRGGVLGCLNITLVLQNA